MKESLWNIEYTSSAKKEILSLDSTVSRFIEKAIDEKLKTDPLRFGRPLRQNLSGFFKLRVGDYRIIYKIEKNEVLVLVVAIGHRRDVYN